MGPRHTSCFRDSYSQCYPIALTRAIRKVSTGEYRNSGHCRVSCTEHCHFAAQLSFPLSHHPSVSVSLFSSWPSTADNLPVTEHQDNAEAGWQDYEDLSDNRQSLYAFMPLLK
ncbi:uncharacterized [Tachysurus ichikawai]